MSQIKDSGEKRVFESGAQRDAADHKARFDLLPVTALERVAKHYAAGAKKYGENNWRKGLPREELLKSGLRHALYAARGDTDEDHFAAVVWNFLNYIETVELGLDKPLENVKPRAWVLTYRDLAGDICSSDATGATEESAWASLGTISKRVRTEKL